MLSSRTGGLDGSPRPPRSVQMADRAGLSIYCTISPVAFL